MKTEKSEQTRRARTWRALAAVLGLLAVLLAAAYVLLPPSDAAAAPANRGPALPQATIIGSLRLRAIPTAAPLRRQLQRAPRLQLPTAVLEPPSLPTGVPTPSLCGGTLSMGDTVQSTIPEAGTDCTYTFSGAAGDAVAIRLNRIDGDLDPFLDLYDPNGVLLQSDDDGGGQPNSLIDNFLLPTGGTYTIHARSLDDQGSGRFELSLDRPSGCIGGLSYGKVVRNQIGYPGAQCSYIFQGTSGDVVTIVMRALAGSLDPATELRDAHGNLVAMGRRAGAGQAMVWMATLPDDGLYTVVAGAAGDATSGAFTLELLRPAVCGGQIAHDQALSGQLATPGARCSYFFSDGSSVGASTFSITSLTPGFRPAFQIFKADGTPVTDVVTDSTDQKLEPGVAYRVVISSLQGSGRFAFTYAGPAFRLLYAPLGASIRPGDLETGSITTEYPQSEYEFQGHAGMVVTIRMTASDRSLDPWLDLMGPNNDTQPLTYDDDGGGRPDSLIWGYSLPVDGTYKIIARSYQNQSTGDYYLSFWAH